MNVKQVSLDINTGRHEIRLMQLPEDAPTAQLLALPGVLQIQVVLENGAIMQYWQDGLVHSPRQPALVPEDWFEDPEEYGG